MHASLSFDHARGTLLHGVSNEELEARLGSAPSLPTAQEHAAAMSEATRQEATAEEVAPFESLLGELLTDEAVLRRESFRCREAFLTFAKEREGGLGRELEAAAALRASPMGVRGEGREEGEGGEGRSDGWWEAVEAAAQAGHSVVLLAPADIKPSRGAVAAADEPTADGAGAGVDAEMELLPATVTYRVVHAPFVFLRKAPSVDAGVLTVLQLGSSVVVDGLRRGWARTAAPHAPLTGGAPQRGWALLDGASVGLGVLLQRV